MAVAWASCFSPITYPVLVGNVDYLLNGGFEAGTLDPWIPEPDAYVPYVKITTDGYEGKYCLSLGPTAGAHGASWVGVYQELISLGVKRVAAPFHFTCMFKKLYPQYFHDYICFNFGEKISLECKPAVNNTIAFTAYRDNTAIGSGTMGIDWNLFEIVARENEYDVLVNGVKIATVPASLSCDRVEVYTTFGIPEGTGSTYLIDAVSLTKQLGPSMKEYLINGSFDAWNLAPWEVIGTAGLTSTPNAYDGAWCLEAFGAIQKTDETYNYIRGGVRQKIPSINTPAIFTCAFQFSTEMRYGYADAVFALGAEEVSVEKSWDAHGNRWVYLLFAGGRVVLLPSLEGWHLLEIDVKGDSYQVKIDGTTYITVSKAILPFDNVQLACKATNYYVYFDAARLYA